MVESEGEEESSEDETSVDGKKAIEQMGGDDGEDELCGDTSEDDLWVNPSTSDIIASMMNKSADEVMLMKPGSNKVHTFSLLDESQRNDIIVYVSNPEPGSKWCLWPRPGEGINDDRSDEGLASKAKTKQATANTAKKADFISKIGGAKDSRKSPSKTITKGKEPS